VTGSRSRAHEGLRQGFTTGSAAAAAAKAALVRLFSGRAPSSVEIPLPPGGRLTIAVETADALEAGASARAAIIKDAGDDPDATHGARISCLATLLRGADSVRIEGGQGVGRVTLPGLPVAVGLAAINPVPLAQIEQAAREAINAAGYLGGVRLVIEVENGEAMAARTLNPRLGITGGISILGTQGIVKPFSLDAWKATIDSGLAVAHTTGCRTAAFATGRRGERLLMEKRPELPERSFVLAADFFAYATQKAVTLKFAEIIWGCFFGKLVKMAQGLPITHAHAAPTDFAALALLAAKAGADPATCQTVRHANTARHALDMMAAIGLQRRFATLVLDRALRAAENFADQAKPGESRPRICICCFGFTGEFLAEAYTS